MKRFLLIAAVVALALWVRTVFYTVDYAEFVYVTRFGERVAVHDGEADAGLKVKAPWAVDERAERVRRQLLGETGGGDSLRVQARAEYGIEILDIRLRRFSYPEAVRGSIADRIRSERERKVAEYQTQARKKAADITTDA